MAFSMVALQVVVHLSVGKSPSPHKGYLVFHLTWVPHVLDNLVEILIWCLLGELVHDAPMISVGGPKCGGFIANP